MWEISSVSEKWERRHEGDSLRISNSYFQVYCSSSRKLSTPKIQQIFLISWIFREHFTDFLVKVKVEESVESVLWWWRVHIFNQYTFLKSCLTPIGFTFFRHSLVRIIIRILIRWIHIFAFVSVIFLFVNLIK